jgi:internalin A
MEKFKYNKYINYLEIDPVFINDGLEFAKENNYTAIRVTPLNHYGKYGFSSSKELYSFKLDTSHFKDNDFIEKLTLEDYIGLDNAGIEGLYTFHNLRKFAFEHPSIKIDLINFPKIEELHFKYNPSVKNISTLKELKEILLFSLNTEDCRFLSNIQNLDFLRLVRGKFVSLNGIENFLNLSKLSVAYNSSLKDLSVLLALPNLKRV